MIIRDTPTGYGIVTRLLHWLMAVGIIGVFALGYWMVTLSYDHPNYNSAPDLHRSVGIILGLVLVFRFVWRLFNVHPDDSELSRFERIGAKAAHWGFYTLLAAITVSGYLITTSDGRPVDVFGLFSIPSAVVEKNLSDTAGYIHWILAYIVIALAVLHSAAALKHHFVDRSSILKRMWSGPPRN
jgi:cytochrome b561